MINPGINKKGSPVLGRATRPSNEFTISELRNIATRLKKALKTSANGIAIAANQVLGEDERIPSMFVYANQVFLDPEYNIIFLDSIASVKEGCLSDPGMEHHPLRAAHIVTRFKKLVLDRKLGKYTIKSFDKAHFSGLDAQVFQHETDHLLGKTIFENAASATIPS